MKYIGIDIGDGESAVACLAEDSVIEPVIQPIDGRGSILSVVGMAGTEVRIGEKALLDRKVVHLRSRFKSRYLNTMDAERDIERFAHGLRTALLEEADDFFDGDVYIAVGCPAGWKENDRARYCEIMKRAGLGDVHIVSESRAAFFYARYAHELKVAPEMLDQTTLVIDIGSSTTDFAYIVNGRESAIGTFGDVSLGGGLIEACMLRRAVAASKHREELETVFRESLSWKNRLEIAARRLKEQYFLDEAEWVKTPCVASETVYYDLPVKVKFELNEDIMREILSTPMDELKGATFDEALSDLLRHAEQATAENPPKLVILTGGASRMRFFREACAAQFPNAQVVICPEPEYSIAKGLAYAARVDDRLDAFSKDIEAYFQSGDVSREIAASLKWLTVPLASILSGRIVHDVVLSVLDEWKCGEIETIEKMDAPIIERTDELVRNLDDIPEIRPAINEWLKKLFQRLQPRLDEICIRHDVDRQSMSLTGVRSLIGPEKVNILLESPVTTTLIYVITGCVTASLCGGGGVVLLMEGPVGILLGALIGLIVAYFGQKAVTSAVSRANLPLFTRRLLCLSFRKSLSSPRQRKAIESALLSSMDSPQFQKQLETDITISLESQIMNMARSVEMPIVQ
ncbi:MAG: Hsp70 family protein [Clostridia bacterium]|nr:Hsp70 family protein [Clostridia bacterium]